MCMCVCLCECKGNFLQIWRKTKKKHLLYLLLSRKDWGKPLALKSRAPANRWVLAVMPLAERLTWRGKQITWEGQEQLPRQARLSHLVSAGGATGQVFQPSPGRLDYLIRDFVLIFRKYMQKSKENKRCGLLPSFKGQGGSWLLHLRPSTGTRREGARWGG